MKLKDYQTDDENVKAFIGGLISVDKKYADIEVDVVDKRIDKTWCKIISGVAEENYKEYGADLGRALKYQHTRKELEKFTLVVESSFPLGVKVGPEKDSSGDDILVLRWLAELIDNRAPYSKYYSPNA